MLKENIDKGVIFVLLDKFNKYQLRRARELIKRLERGDLLDDYDYEYIRNELKVVWEVEKLVKRNPEYQELFIKSLSLLNEILDKAFENENKPRLTRNLRELKAL